MGSSIVGWILLFSGLALIGYGLFSSWQVFSGQAAPQEIFAWEQLKAPNQGKSTSLGFLGLELPLDKILGSQVEQILPSGAISKLLNLLSFSALAGILIFGGGQIAGLGIKLLKN